MNRPLYPRLLLLPPNRDGRFPFGVGSIVSRVGSTRPGTDLRGIYGRVLKEFSFVRTRPWEQRVNSLITRNSVSTSMMNLPKLSPI